MHRWVALALACVAVALAACGPTLDSHGADPGAEHEPTVAPPVSEAVGDLRIPVRTRVLEARPFTERFEVTGAVRPWREYALAAEFGGLVRDVRFERGDAVEDGEVLALVGDDLASARLDQSRADLLASEANYEKVSRLAERDAVPKQDLVAATARRDRDRAVVAEAEVRLDRATIRSPARGRVIERSVDPGEVIPPGAAVATVQETDRLKIEAAVPDTEIAWLEDGARASIHVDAWADREFDGRIVYIAPAADPVTRTFTIEIEVPDAERALRPGMVVRVLLDRRSVAAAVAVPLDSLVTRVDGTVAYVVRDCRAESRAVSLGGSEGEDVLVLAGLSVGDELVVDGQRNLADGQPVRSESCR